jgi:hypothetical protein
MKLKSYVKAALLVFVFGSLAFLAVKESRQWTAPAPVAAQEQRPAVGRSASASMATKPQTNKVIAYYFHTTYRCATCRRIEAYSKEAIDLGFARELADGRLEFRLVNVEKPENQHFAQDYKLFTKSLVLVRMKDGNQVEWTNLSRVWELTGAHEAFLRYVQQEVRAYLEKD